MSPLDGIVRHVFSAVVYFYALPPPLALRGWNSFNLWIRVYSDIIGAENKQLHWREKKENSPLYEIVFEGKVEGQEGVYSRTFFLEVLK